MKLPSARLSNLAQLLNDTNRRADAGPLMRRALGIFVNCSLATGHLHPNLEVMLSNYEALLMEMGDTEPQAHAKIEKIIAPLE